MQNPDTGPQTVMSYLAEVEENFLLGRIPFTTYKKTLDAYLLWQEQAPQTEN